MFNVLAFIVPSSGSGEQPSRIKAVAAGQE
jgi:hypothetical protein